MSHIIICKLYEVWVPDITIIGVLPLHFQIQFMQIKNFWNNMIYIKKISLSLLPLVVKSTITNKKRKVRPKYLVRENYVRHSPPDLKKKKYSRLSLKQKSSWLRAALSVRTCVGVEGDYAWWHFLMQFILDRKFQLG